VIRTLGVSVVAWTFACSSYAQTQAEASHPDLAARPTTKLDAFVSNKGHLIIKDYYDLGTSLPNTGR
jgi:hypothetical protein